jgi:hypothetical protein
MKMIIIMTTTTTPPTTTIIIITIIKIKYHYYDYWYKHIYSQFTYMLYNTYISQRIKAKEKHLLFLSSLL